MVVLNMQGESSTPYVPPSVFPDQHLRLPNDWDDVSMDGNSDAASFATADDDDRGDEMDLDIIAIDNDSDEPTANFNADPGNKDAQPSGGADANVKIDDKTSSSVSQDHASPSTPSQEEEAAQSSQSAATPTSTSIATTTKAKSSADPKPFIPPVMTEKDLDLSLTIKNMYRILDLVKERGSGGLVDKIIISQDSFQLFINALSPRSCLSMTKCDFTALDKSIYRVVGVYGERGEIVRYLEKLGALDAKQALALGMVADASANNHKPHLRSGIYGVLENQTIHVIYWPEDATWNDDAPSDARRNRITFIRYLTKIADQVVALISPAQAFRLVWKANNGNERDGDGYGDGYDDDLDEFNDEEGDSDRLFSFEVSKSKEQEEGVSARLGFEVPMPKPLKSTAEDPIDSSDKRFAPFLARGDSMTAFVSVTRKRETTSKSQLQHTISPIALKTWVENESFRLAPDLKEESLEILVVHGIAKRAPEAFAALEAARQDALLREANHKAEGVQKLKGSNEKMGKRIVPAMRALLQAHVSDLYSLDLTLIEAQCQKLVDKRKAREAVKDVDCAQVPLPLSDDEDEGEDAPSSANSDQRYMHDLLVRSPYLDQTMKDARKKVEETLDDPEYRKCKTRIRVAQEVLDKGLALDDAKTHDLVKKIMDADDYDLRQLASSTSSAKNVLGSLFSTLTSMFSTDTISSTIKQALSRAEKARDKDKEFWKNANEIASRHTILAQYVAKASKMAIRLRSHLIEKKLPIVVKEIMNKHEFMCQKAIEKQAGTEREAVFAKSLREYLGRVEGRFLIGNRPQTHMIERVIRKETPRWSHISSYGTHGYESYNLIGSTTTRIESTLRYRIQPLYLSEVHRQSLQTNPLHIPSPTVHQNSNATFDLPESHDVLYLHLIHEPKITRVLLITKDLQGDTYIFLEELSVLSSALARGKNGCKKPLSRDKMGSNLTFGFDEGKRQLAVCTASHLHMFSFDEQYQSLNGFGTPVNLAGWYDSTSNISIQEICFVGQQEEIALLDSSNRVRIFSLVTQVFRPASLALDCRPDAVFSTPDGSCLCCVNTTEDGVDLRAFHWSNFGSSAGVLLSFDGFPGTSFSLTSFVNSSSIHILGLGENKTCRSMALDITKRVTEFSFMERGARHIQEDTKIRTANNCLLDCHSEVWTRFPVVAAVRRKTIGLGTRRPKSITFVTDRDHSKYASHFKDMIITFERTTRKPTERVLSDLAIRALAFDEYSAEEHEFSQFQAGEWIMQLICLIPIHLAVTRDNRFIPFKDGVSSSDVERELLGAKVEQIVDMLSFGWYESIFSSYMSKMPVKVVSSMGEQSVGKSYALNHFCDTSFAGSAMRTTEGVWMSVTPNDEALVVALDFEGVHSIERSAQEDTLLVLFNAALSNMVLFRNNFALSRDIAGMFQSFQSSATILDPQANPSLFKSTLVIIIKDVIESDKHEITKEFRLKFQEIVRMEQGQNFLTRLHSGAVDIIPWPVIESREFYRLFVILKRSLDKQRVTHTQAGVFLQTMKTLMAKLKANDWGSLSQNMAQHRAQLLEVLLLNALRYGAAEIVPDIEPLRDLDTNEPIETDDSGVIFPLHPGSMRLKDQTSEQLLDDLRQQYPQISQRMEFDDHEWMNGLQEHLEHLVQQRVKHVEEWLNRNIARFSSTSSMSNFEDLRRRFNGAIVDMKACVQACGLQCASCNLLCLSVRHHEGSHDCGTAHTCIHPCHFSDDHEDEKECGLPAGHGGEHICDITAHLCGQPCALENRVGCLQRCSKVVNHEDEEHMCPAKVHECGEPCSLAGIRLANGSMFDCPEKCRISIDENHELHVCGNRSCPITCQLCKRLCSNTDHLHGLDDSDHHLCGQDHACNALCALQGLCHIETTPQSVQATFTGRHESFQFTKYSQVSRRLQCVIPIPAGSLSHLGTHRHSQDEDLFHYCEARCENCGYFCTLPLGHPQTEHDTRHGSMSRTKWVVEGADSTVELNGRKFGNADDGAPMLCSMVCKSMGRHAHIDFCRNQGSTCLGSDIQHIKAPVEPHPSRSKDWVSHKLYWQRTGFKDPYSKAERDDFAKCDSMCPGTEHEASATTQAQPSYCTLPIFHPPSTGTTGVGYTSNDGHHFACTNPAVMKQAFHVIFVIDRSGSMQIGDRLPLAGTPNTARIASVHNNRLGAVYSSLDGFWSARSAAQGSTAAGNNGRRDAYSIILFDHDVVVAFQNDFTSSPDALLNTVLRYGPDGGTNFTLAVETAQVVMESNWSTERTPVVIFLSDGDASMPDNAVSDICRRSLARGKALSFHTVAFGSPNSQVLRRMAEIATQIRGTAPPDPLNPIVPSSYTEALDTIRLAETFLGLADSLTKPRGFLMKTY